MTEKKLDLRAYNRLMKRKLVLKPDHPQLAEFLKTDQTFESYLNLLGKFMDQMPCDNSRRRPAR
jgi:hypothetical protein